MSLWKVGPASIPREALIPLKRYFLPIRSVSPRILKARQSLNRCSQTNAALQNSSPSRLPDSSSHIIANAIYGLPTAPGTFSGAEVKKKRISLLRPTIRSSLNNQVQSTENVPFSIFVEYTPSTALGHFFNGRQIFKIR